MKIRTDFVTNSSSSSFVTIRLQSDLIDKYLEAHEVIIDEESYTSAKELFEAIEVGGDWLYGYSLEDTPGLINILSFFLTATDPEFEEEQEPDETVVSFLKYLSDNKEEIEKNVVGNICVFSMNDGAPLEIDGLRFNKGAVTKLNMEIYDEDDEAEAFFDLQWPEDVDQEALQNLFESHGQLLP